MRKLNKRAFTLIELLAVILILGIIALIAIPTVSNIIEDSKRQSYVRSAEGLLSSVDTKINLDMLKGEDINVAYNFKDGKLLNGELDIKGAMPKEGKVRVNIDGEVALAIVYDKYCITKLFSEDKSTATVLDENGCDLPGDNSIMRSPAFINQETSAWEQNTYAFYNVSYREKIVSINFLYQEDVPSNALISWDVSNAQDESIMAYLMTNGDKYDLYIISGKNIYVNENSYCMFQNFIELKKINFSNFNTKNMRSLMYMFTNCEKLEELDLSGFDTSKVANMHAAFNNCLNLKKINLSGLDTSNIYNMVASFKGCIGLTELDLSDFDTSNVTQISQMFKDCTNLKKLDISSFDISKVEDLYQMFRGCSSLEILDLTSFDTSKVTGMTSLFADCTNLRTIYVSNKWSTESLEVGVASMYNGCGTDTVTIKN